MSPLSFLTCVKHSTVFPIFFCISLKNIGLNQHILQWIASYLCNRQQYVVVDGASSDTVLSGVPQGSVLGPLLFLIYINHVFSLTLTDGSKLTMYTDDILLYKPIKDYSGLQTDIDAIQDCISTNYLTMNPQCKKCKCLICLRKIHPHLPPSGLLLGGMTLEQVESYHYLGVLVSSRLTWSDHIEHVCAKARKLVGMLYRQSVTVMADSNTLLLIYRTCIRPHLEYACQLWDPFLNKGMQSLKAVQKFACKVCLSNGTWTMTVCCNYSTSPVC